MMRLHRERQEHRSTDLEKQATEVVLHLYRYQRLQRVAEEEGDKADELQVYADFLRIVLEILNCILVTNLPANPELVYAMLHQQEIFMPFQVDLSAAMQHAKLAPPSEHCCSFLLSTPLQATFLRTCAALPITLCIPHADSMILQCTHSLPQVVYVREREQDSCGMHALQESACPHVRCTICSQAYYHANTAYNLLQGKAVIVELNGSSMILLCIHIVLELNVCLLAGNASLAVRAWSTPNKQYVLLQGDAVFGELAENITAVIRYFNAQVEQARGFGGWDWSVEKVLDVIKGRPPAPGHGQSHN